MKRPGDLFTFIALGAVGFWYNWQVTLAAIVVGTLLNLAADKVRG